MTFEVIKLKIPDVILIRPKVLRDNRGFFAEVFKYPVFKKIGINTHWLQVNHSKSEKNVLRGLHYQKSPKAQAKLIRVLFGEIFDVAVDVRKKSPYYGQWVGVKLSSKNMDMLYVPEGFAHGFCILSPSAEVEYFASAPYAPRLERGVVWNDPVLGIDWPVKRPILSSRDKKWPSFLKGQK